METTPFPYLIISNPRQVTAGKLAGHTGYWGWESPRATRYVAGPRPTDPATIIPRDQWAAKIAALPPPPNLPAKDQNGLNLCWAYGSVRAAEQKRARLNLPYIDLSPESVAGPCTGWRNEGGYASEAFNQIQTYGIAPSACMDKPHSLDVGRWQPEWQEEALQHEAIDWIDIEQSDNAPNFDEVITALLNGDPLAAGLDWWGHLVCFIAPIILPPGTAPINTPTGDTVGVLFQNSWGADWPTPGANGYAVLTQELAKPDGAASPLIAT